MPAGRTRHGRSSRQTSRAAADSRWSDSCTPAARPCSASTAPSASGRCLCSPSCVAPTAPSVWPPPVRFRQSAASLENSCGALWQHWGRFASCLRSLNCCNAMIAMLSRLFDERVLEGTHLQPRTLGRKETMHQCRYEFDREGLDEAAVMPHKWKSMCTALNNGRLS